MHLLESPFQEKHLLSCKFQNMHLPFCSPHSMHPPSYSAQFMHLPRNRAFSYAPSDRSRRSSQNMHLLLWHFKIYTSSYSSSYSVSIYASWSKRVFKICTSFQAELHSSEYPPFWVTDFQYIHLSNPSPKIYTLSVWGAYPGDLSCYTAFQYMHLLFWCIFWNSV